MICEKCREVIPVGEEMSYRGKVLCEDCYIEVVSVPKICDVAAVHGAKQARERAGQKGTAGLTQMQKEIYEYVKTSGKVTPEALAEKFGLSDLELQRQLAVLRHCELLKGALINGKKYIVVMQGQA